MTTAYEDKPRPRELNDVRGWFPPLDQVLFERLLTRQEDRGEQGDLLELGVFMGKSAIFLGHHLRDGDRFTVCDLFESEAPDLANSAETAKSYPTLTRDAFERNYLSFHDELPRVLQAPSSVIPGEVEPKSCRFVHIDASHLYEHVYGDIGAAQELLKPGGIVVLDDFRSEHTPGVSIATWEAVLTRGLRPICLSTQKLYGTWDDPEPIQDELIAMAEEREDCDLSVQQAAGHRIVRLKSRGMTAPDFPFSKYYTEETPAPAELPGPEPVASPAAPRRRSARSRVRRVAIDVLPPVITRAVQRSRAQRRA
ncbi:class I SAM-dependent methyltransferase [Streptomyces sp. NPDC058220]|uniref:class I SAM-dependent methyltransferase n=1 Tax=unclassified Streptomyces TaxID=2593676 RepID=UPI0036488603